MEWTKLADNEMIRKTVDSLKGRGFDVTIAENGEEAKKKVLEIIPQKAEVMVMTSITLEKTGIAKEIDESGNYDSVRKRIISIKDEKERALARKKHAMNPDWAVGSVHAITEDGQVMVASGSGSQLPAYAFGASNVVWVVSTKKLVKSLEQGMERIYEYSLPLESERINKLYGMTRGSSVNKILLLEHEWPGRIRIILVKEDFGY
jgi:acyl-CoA hydrolase